jgi:hypothetical protein
MALLSRSFCLHDNVGQNVYILKNCVLTCFDLIKFS